MPRLYLASIGFRCVARLVLGGCAWMVAGLSVAQVATAPDFQEMTRNWLRTALVAAQPGDAKLRMEATVGSLDGRLKLAPCGNVETYLPAGSRLWGKTRVGLRCVDGMTRWNVSIPVTVRALGTAWVVKNHVPAGSPLSEADLVEAEVDWAEDLNPVLKDRSLWLGQVTTRLLSTGQTLRQGMVKPAQVFQAGAQVKVVAQGAGFEISSDAQALSAGVVGQLARVRMDSGRISSGMVLDARTVKIDL